jgi:hypothetical protein
MDKQDKVIYIREYLEFKEEAVKQGIFDIEEIIKLYKESLNSK